MNKRTQLLYRDNYDIQIQAVKAAMKQNTNRRMHIKIPCYLKSPTWAPKYRYSYDFRALCPYRRCLHS